MDTENANRDFPGEYRLDVEDFGPIAKASVDLRPLTVFIGPSNTGKSYLAILIYALHQCFNEVSIGTNAWRARYGDQLSRSVYSALREADEDASEMLDRFRTWIQMQFDKESQPQLPIDIKSNIESRSAGQETQPMQDFPQDVDKFIRSTFEQPGGLDGYAESEIGRCFGVDDMSDLVRRLGSIPCANIILEIPRIDGAGMARYELELHEDGVGVSVGIGGDRSLSHELMQLGISDTRSLHTRRVNPRVAIDSEDIGYSLARMAQNISRSLLRPLYRSAYYLPADRTGVMHSHQVVVSALVQSATTAGLRRSVNIPILSGVLADFLDQLIEIGGQRVRVRSRSRRRTARSSEKLAMNLEQDVLKGTVQIEDVGSGYPSFYYRPERWRETLPLMQASSMVSELAPVVLYLRYVVRPNDVLIIEEPESHLHPAMQVEFLRQIAGLVRAGIRVIVTTHSEWLLQELANLVQLSQLPEAEREGIAGADVALEPEQVGAWLFESQASGEGSKVREIGLDESGLYPAGFDDVAAAMHNDWAEILSRRGDHE